jgi:methyltransferase-like protein 6
MYVQNNEYVSAIEAYILAIIGPPGIPLDALLSPVRAFDTYHYIPTEIIPVDTSSLIIDKRGCSFTNQGPAKVDNIDNILEDPNLLWIEDKDIDEDRIRDAQERIAKQGGNISLFWRNKYINEAGKYWHTFYRRNLDHFYKDRHYLHIVFPELAPENCQLPTTLLEVGCGVGNAVIPLLDINPNLTVHAIDFASSAIEILTKNPYTISNRLYPSVCDVVNHEIPVEDHSMSYILCMFVLSAIAPVSQAIVVKKLMKKLKPGGKLFIRDYGRYDEAQLRFNKGSKIDDNFYVRCDGTCAYYFEINELKVLMESQGLHSEECSYILRQYANRSQKVARRRVWIHGKFACIDNHQN